MSGRESRSEPLTTRDPTPPRVGRAHLARARAVSASAASFFCCSPLPPGWIMPALISSLAASSTEMLELDDVAPQHIEEEAGRRDSACRA